MKDTLNKAIIFAAGAAIGSAVTWKLVKNKYEQIAQEEIDSVKEAFFRREQELITPDNDESMSHAEEVVEEFETGLKNTKPPLKEYAETLRKQGYVDYTDYEKEEDVDMMKPVVIAPEEFGEDETYDTISLTYFADNYLTDDRNLLVDVEKTVGKESLTHFGEFEDDSVFVRNDELKVYYEILLDERSYVDLINERPHPEED